MRRRAGSERIFVGTSGWSYPHWVGPFYPRGLAARDWLGFYAGRLRSVEINGTFYRLPEGATLARWRASVPPDFVFAVKASRYLTHRKKLAHAAAPARAFLRRVAALGAQLGPVLFQLPPRWGCDLERLAAFLAALPRGFRYAFEFRDRSWLNERVFEELARHGAALAAYELGGYRSPLATTADFAYLRLHGPRRAYGGCYGARALARWAAVIERWAAQGLAVYCYFDNDEAGYAARNALELARRLGGGAGAARP